MTVASFLGIYFVHEHVERKVWKRNIIRTRDYSQVAIVKITYDSTPSSSSHPVASSVLATCTTSAYFMITLASRKYSRFVSLFRWLQSGPLAAVVLLVLRYRAGSTRSRGCLGDDLSNMRSKDECGAVYLAAIVYLGFFRGFRVFRGLGRVTGLMSGRSTARTSA